MKGQHLRPMPGPQDGERVARQGLARHDAAQVVGEVGEARQTAGLAVQMREIEAPAVALPAAVFAHTGARRRAKNGPIEKPKLTKFKLVF